MLDQGDERVFVANVAPPLELLEELQKVETVDAPTTVDRRFKVAPHAIHGVHVHVANLALDTMRRVLRGKGKAMVNGVAG